MIVSVRLAIYRPAPLNPARPRLAPDARLRRLTSATAGDETPATLVSRFRSSHHYAARSFANFGNEGH